MGEEVASENGKISNFQGLVTLTLDWVTLHHSSTSTYKPNFIEIEETFCGQTDERTHVRMYRHLRPTLLGQLRSVDLKPDKSSWSYLISKPINGKNINTTQASQKIWDHQSWLLIVGKLWRLQIQNCKKKQKIAKQCTVQEKKLTQACRDINHNIIYK